MSETKEIQALIEHLKDAAENAAHRKGFHVCDEQKTIEAQPEWKAADLISSLQEENRRLMEKNNELEDQIDTIMGKPRRARAALKEVGNG